MRYVLKNRNFWIMALGDAVLLAFSYYFSYMLRFDGNIPPDYLFRFAHSLIWIVPLKLIFFLFFDLYKGMWRYTSIHDLINLLKACITSSATIVILLLLFVRFGGFPRSVFIIDSFLTFLFIGGYRIGIRLYYARKSGKDALIISPSSREVIKKLLMIGAGDATDKFMREIRDNPNLKYDVVGLIDDDPLKLHRTIHGVPVLGDLNDMNRIVKRFNVDEILIAIPSATAMEMRRMVNSCENVRLPFKTLPGLGELIEGDVSVSHIRDVRYEDLLGREPVNLNMDQIGKYLTGKRVLVTGGAGSIGSELCRQILKFEPGQLVILDKNESGIYEMELDLSARNHEIEIHSVLGSVQNMMHLGNIFNKHKPEVVFHAAAYKHVPMMELHPCEAVFNNIIGTKNILELCSSNGVDRFVLVSTDKAVRPTNVMGASKRVDEILCQIYGKNSECKFMSVRFGNVVGSAGSVIPLFRRQIERGGPVTVTHPGITRYFMTITEASQLILQAGALGNGGEIFILKMGTPIRIADMARDLIRLSGYKPDEEIEIKYIDLRPGEKLYEELITEGEGIMETEHEDIMVLNSENSISIDEMDAHISRLVEHAKREDTQEIKNELKRIVPEYTPQ